LHVEAEIIDTYKEQRRRQIAMRINSNRSQPIPLPTADGAVGTTPPTAGNDTAADRPVAALGGYAPSPELQQLTVLAQLQPDVRPDVVRAVVARLSQGYYTTPASAEQTAQAMLGAVD
jgi:hypothetical protein